MKALLIVASFLSFSVHAQKLTYSGFPSLVWPKLYNISFVTGKDAEGEFQKPVFTPAVKGLSGKTISIPGYIVPFDNGLKANRFMFSSLPLNACFFCGVGGPETVVEVFSKEIIPYTDKPVEIRGTLRLNETDPDQMIYQLFNAEVLGPVEM